MRVVAVLCLACMVSGVVSPAFAGAPGIFQGRVYQDGHGAGGWIYVQGRNGMLRRVEISRARVVYADSVPKGERGKDAGEDLVPGAEVRVTAEQDGAGKWRASRVEILEISGHRSGKTLKLASR